MAVDFSGQIAALQTAIASGLTSVSYEGKNVSYRSLAEMQSTVAYLQRAQARANGSKVQNVALSNFDRGYRCRNHGLRG